MSPSNLPATPEAQLQQELAQHRQYQLQMLQQQQDEEPVEQVHQQQQQQQQQQHNQQQQQQAVLRPQAQQTSGLATPNPQASLEYHRQLLAQRLADKSVLSALDPNNYNYYNCPARSLHSPLSHIGFLCMWCFAVFLGGRYGGKPLKPKGLTFLFLPVGFE